MLRRIDGSGKRIGQASYLTLCPPLRDGWHDQGAEESRTEFERTQLLLYIFCFGIKLCGTSILDLCLLGGRVFLGQEGRRIYPRSCQSSKLRD